MHQVGEKLSHYDSRLTTNSILHLYQHFYTHTIICLYKHSNKNATLILKGKAYNHEINILFLVYILHLDLRNYVENWIVVSLCMLFLIIHCYFLSKIILMYV